MPAYLSGDLDHFSSINYHGKEYYLHTKQMDSLKGFYIATFVDKNLKHASNSIALNTTVILQIAYWLLLMVFYLIIYLTTRKRSKLKQKIFLFNWLRPYLGKGQSQYYQNSLAANILVIIYLLVIWMFWHTHLIILFNTLLLSGFGIIIFQFYNGSGQMPYQKKVHTLFHLMS